jgi:hypothetical protein
VIAAGFQVDRVNPRDRLRCWLESWLPWYDPDHEARREARSRAIVRISLAARRQKREVVKADRLGSYSRVSARR